MTQAIKFIGKRMRGGKDHEHITHLFWAQCINGEATRGCTKSSLQEMCTYIETMGNNSVWCPDPDPKIKGVWVHLQTNGKKQYLQSVYQGRKTDHLLKLPDM